MLDAIREALARAGEAPPAEVDAVRFAAAVGKALAKLDTVDAGGGFDEVEEKLAAVESSLLKGIRPALGEKASADLEVRVDELLEGSASLSSASMGRLRKALLRRELRNLVRLPPLTLFGG